jgi:hypothetical protein
MNLITALVSSLWFWIDVFFSVVGAVVVYWGLKIGGEAEHLIPPSDFKKDIFGDIVNRQKEIMERGHRIVMAGVVIEAVAALLLSVFSGLAIADSKERATNAEKLAIDGKVKIATLQSTNLLLQAAFWETRSNVLALEAKQKDRTITAEQRKSFIDFLRNAPKGKIRQGTRHADRETTVFATKIFDMLSAADYPSESTMNYPENMVAQNEGSSVMILYDTRTNAPPYLDALWAAFEHIGVGCSLGPNVPNRFYSPAEGHGEPSNILVMVVEKP